MTKQDTTDTASGTYAAGAHDASSTPKPTGKRGKTGPLYKRVTNTHPNGEAACLPGLPPIAAGDSVVMHVSEIKNIVSSIEGNPSLTVEDTA